MTSRAVEFSGAKLFLLSGDALLVYRRDDRPDIPFPGCWDVPGGGREGDETAEACVLRELKEEFDLELAADRFVWRRRYPSWRTGASDSVFFAARCEPVEIEGVTFGEEGQYWQMMATDDYLSAPDAIDHHVERFRDFLTHG